MISRQSHAFECKLRIIVLITVNQIALGFASFNYLTVTQHSKCMRLPIQAVYGFKQSLYYDQINIAPMYTASL